MQLLVSSLRGAVCDKHGDGQLLHDAADAIDDLQAQVQLLSLETDLEEDLSARIAEMHKYIAMNQGFTMNGIARLLSDCQKRMAADWVEVGRHRINTLRS